MMIVMDRQVSVAQVARVTAFLGQMGCQAQISRDKAQTAIGVIDDVRPFDQSRIEGMDGVRDTLSNQGPFKRASRDFQPQDTLEPVSLAAAAPGADGLLVEVCDSLETALFDGAQSLCPERFRSLVERLRPVAEAVGRAL